MKSTKKALLLSMMSMLLCVAMLMGTTFAWFTDSVTSGTNKIVAGNLDVVLYHQSKNVAKTEVTESTENLFKDVTLWEPGAYAYETFTIANEGKLALKFKMALNVLAFTSYNGHNLTEVIKVATAETAPATREAAAALSYTALKDWSLTDYSGDNNKLNPGDFTTFTVVLYWEPTDHDNDFNMNNGKTNEALTIDLGITLVATQQMEESDSFGTDYDQHATNTIATVLPAENVIVPIEKNDDNTLKTAITINAEKSSSSITAPIGTKLAEGATSLGFKLEPKTNAESGVTVGDPTEESAVCYNIVITGLAADNGKPLTAKINVGAGMTEVKAYHSGNPMEQVTNISDLADGKYYYDSASGEVTFMSKSFSPFDFIVKDGKIHLYDAAQLKAFAAKVNEGNNEDNYYKGKTVVLMNDVNLENIEWTQINGAGKNITFDGNGKTIKNLKVSTGHNAGFFSTGSGCTIKNLTFDGATVKGIGRIGVICGHGMCVIVDNCTVKNASVEAVVTNNDDGDKAGAIVGYLSGESVAKVTNCTVENCTVKGYRDVGALVGYMGGTYTVTGNKASNVQVIGDRNNNYKNYTQDAEFDVNTLIGEDTNAGTKNNNTDTNVTVSYTLAISTADELRAFAAAVNGGKTYAKFTVYLTNDIDLKNEAWTPIGNVTSYPSVSFYGTFDGQNHTISNLTCTDTLQNHATAGLFGSLMGTVKNVNLKNVNITSAHYAGGIVGYSSSSGSKVIDCTVDGGTITSTPELINEAYDNGDKAGGIFGANCEGGSIEGCTVKNVTITAHRDLGGIAGATANSNNIKNCRVENVLINQSNENGYKSGVATVGKLVGRVTGENDKAVDAIDGCTVTNVTIKKAPIVIVVPEDKTVKDTVSEAIGKATSGDTLILPKTEEDSDKIKLPEIKNNITLKGEVDEEGKPATKVDAKINEGSIASIPNGATFENVVIDFTESEVYAGFQHAGKITFKNCILNGFFMTYGDMEFIDCTFNAPGKGYSMWTYGKDATFTRCTFNGQGKWINVYCESNTVAYNITFNECKFVNKAETANKAGINVKDTCGSTQLKYNVTINNCTYEGVAPAAEMTDGLHRYNSVVQLDDIGAGPSNIIIVQDDVTLWPEN